MLYQIQMLLQGYHLHYVKRVHIEINHMEKQGEISKVNEPVDWINLMVVVEKPSRELRLCLDPRDLYKNVKTDQFKIPTIDEITAKLSGSKYFTKLDASSSFWTNETCWRKCKMDPFSTPLGGNYCFQCFPFGLNIWCQAYQKTLWNWFQDSEGVELYVDDILIHVPNIKTLRSRIQAFLQIIWEKNLRLKKVKCILKENEVKFLEY